MDWHYIDEKHGNIGPVSEMELAALIASGTVKRKTLVWNMGMDDWKEAGESVASVHFGSQTPPPPPPPARDGVSANPPAPPPQSCISILPGQNAPENDLIDQARPTKRVADCWIVKCPLIAICLIAVVAIVFKVGFRLVRDGEPLGIYDWTVGGHNVMAIVVLVAASIGALLVATSIFYHFVVLYRAWSLIPVDQRSTSPAKAVGLLFIPLFNFYWIFRAYWCLAQTHKQLRPRSKGTTPGLSLPLFFIFCLTLNIPLFIPPINAFALPVALIAGILVNWQLARLVNHHARGTRSSDGLIITGLSLIPMAGIAGLWVFIVKAADDNRQGHSAVIQKETSHHVSPADGNSAPTLPAP